MHSTFLFAGLALPILTLAAPAYQATGKTRLPSAIFSRQDNGSNCDLANVQQPANTMTAPGSDLALVLIALGKGTQNYTCTDAAATPSPIGAFANLFNASCDVASGSLGSIQEDAASIGTHFFVDNTTPDFDIIGLGNTQAKKVESMAAPQSTDVPWLRLEAQQATSSSPVRQIYRLNTVGGVAPTSCKDQDLTKAVTVEYEAQYWIYASKAEIQARRKRRSLGLPVV